MKMMVLTPHLKYGGMRVSSLMAIIKEANRGDDGLFSLARSLPLRNNKPPIKPSQSNQTVTKEITQDVLRYVAKRNELKAKANSVWNAICPPATEVSTLATSRSETASSRRRQSRAQSML